MKIRIKLISLLLAALMLFLMLPITAFAAENKEYIKEVRISTAATEDAAKQWLIENGYQVLDFNLNQKSGGDAVYLGYLTTTNPKEAITDMAVMQMNGGYSFAQFEELLKQQEENVNDALRAIEVTIREAREKYAAGKENAKGAYQVLNYFIEDDSGKLMGDYLLADQINAKDLSKVMLQSNSDFTLMLYSMLAWACTEVGDESWMAKLETQKPYGDYEDVYYRDIALSIFDDYEAIHEAVESFEVYFYGNIIDSINEMTDEELEAFVADMPEEKLSDFGLFMALAVYEYNGKSFAEFFREDPDEIDLEDLYPILDAMSEGQRHIADTVGLDTLVFFAQNDAESAKSYIDTCLAEFITYEIDGPISIYTGVDRSIFSDGGVALTNASLRESASTGDSSWYSEDNIDTALSAILHTISAGAMVTAIAAPIAASKHFAVKAASAAAMSEESKLFAVASKFYNEDLVGKLAIKDAQEALQWKYNVVNYNQAEAYKELEALAKTNPTLNSELNDLYNKKAAHKHNMEIRAQQNNKLIRDKYDEVFESVMKKAKHVAMIAMGVSLVVEAVVIGIKLYNYYYGREYSVIPRIIVDNIETETDSYYVRYYATLDQNGDYADLNAWFGQRWNALYTSKDEDAGDPILASGLVAKLKSNSMPTAQSYGVHYFGETGACNLSGYLLRSTAPATYMFFTRDHSLRATASAFSRGTVVTFVSIGVVGGIAIGSLGTIGAEKLKLKKKKNEEEESTDLEELETDLEELQTAPEELQANSEELQVDAQESETEASPET